MNEIWMEIATSEKPCHHVRAYLYRKHFGIHRPGRFTRIRPGQAAWQISHVPTGTYVGPARSLRAAQEAIDMLLLQRARWESTSFPIVMIKVLTRTVTAIRNNPESWTAHGNSMRIAQDFANGMAGP